MERVSFETVCQRYPTLDPDLQEGIYHVANLFRFVSSLPSKRVTYEAQIFVKDRMPGKISTVPEKAAIIEKAVRELVPVHPSRTDAHPEGHEAFIEGEELKSNPFPYDRFKEDHLRWKNEWHAAQSE
jgi:hypothetical protein